MGPATTLAREFMSSRRKGWLLEPRTANLAMLAILSIPVVLSEPFLRNPLFNAISICAWFALPAFSRKWPVWGIIAGFFVLEVFGNVVQGTANLQRDLQGMGIFALMTLVTYLTGCLVRWSVRTVQRLRVAR